MIDIDVFSLYIVSREKIVPFVVFSEFTGNDNYTDLLNNLESGLLKKLGRDDLEKLEEGSLYSESNIVRQSISRKKLKENFYKNNLDLLV